jgi:2-(1,2-epoxy-1,2-dihydrophenyl)acetyl-CoA isomerase
VLATLQSANMPASSPIILDHTGPVAWIRFNRPEAINAINAQMAQAFHAAASELAADNEIRVIVLAGTGRAFVAGGDLTRIQAAPKAVADELIEPIHEGMLMLTQHQAPLIASVVGVAAGAGLSIVAACDLAIAADTTKFTFAYSSVGVSCDVGASWTLPRLIGLRRAMQLALVDEPLTAEEALRIGLINYVVPAAELPERTRQLAQRLAAAPPLALAALKRLFRQSSNQPFAAQLEQEREAFQQLAQTEDCREAVTAFFEKRAGLYHGR